MMIILYYYTIMFIILWI